MYGDQHGMLRYIFSDALKNFQSGLKNDFFLKKPEFEKKIASHTNFHAWSLVFIVEEC